MAVVLGLNCKLFRGDAGSTATTELTAAKDVSLSLETATADVTDRSANGWRLNVATLKEASIEFEMNYDPTGADCQALNEAFLNNSVISMFVGDDQGNGLDADVMITNFSLTQNLEEAATVSVTAQPTNSGRAPAWITNGPTGN